MNECDDPTCGCGSRPKWPDDSGVCEGCNRKKDRVIRRGKRTLCDDCFEQSDERLRTKDGRATYVSTMGKVAIERKP